MDWDGIGLGLGGFSALGLAKEPPSGLAADLSCRIASLTNPNKIHRLDMGRRFSEHWLTLLDPQIQANHVYPTQSIPSQLYIDHSQPVVPPRFVMGGQFSKAS